MRSSVQLSRVTRSEKSEGSIQTATSYFVSKIPKHMNSCPARVSVQALLGRYSSVTLRPRDLDQPMSLCVSHRRLKELGPQAHLGFLLSNAIQTSSVSAGSGSIIMRTILSSFRHPNHDLRSMARAEASWNFVELPALHSRTSQLLPK